jgi:hypothetical protein
MSVPSSLFPFFLMSSNPLTESRFEAQSKKIETILVLEGKKRKIII